MNDLEKNDILADDEVTIIDYIKIIVSRRWLIVGFTFFCVLFTYVLTNIQKKEPLFLAKTIILTNEQSDYLKTGIEDNAVAQQTYQTIIYTNHFLRKLIARKYEYTKNGEQLEEDLFSFYETDNEYGVLGKLSNSIDMENRQGGMLEISTTTADAELSASIANYIVSQLIVYNQEQRNSNAKLNLQFIENRLDEVGEELATARNNLVDFLGKNKQLLIVNPNQNNFYPVITVEKEKLEQEVNLKSNLYNTLSNQFELAKIEAQKEIPVITVIDYAEPPLSPLPVNTNRNALVALFSGLFVSVTLAFFLNYIEGIDKETRGFFSKQFQKEKRFMSIFWKNGNYRARKDKEMNSPK